MKQYYESLKSLITQDLISKAATLFNEDESRVSKAVSVIISGLLGIMLKKGNDGQMKNILCETGKATINAASNIKDLWDEKQTSDQQKYGDLFLQELLGDNAVEFAAAVCKNTEIEKVPANWLIEKISPLMAEMLGNRIIKRNWDITDLLSEINQQKSSFSEFIPIEMIAAFELSEVLKDNYSVGDKQKGSKWILWVILAIFFILLLFWWKLCH